MNITMEQVEKVRACARCSYETAKAALEETGGNVLEAVILLERRADRTQQGGDYSTREEQEAPRAQGEWKRPTGREVRQVLASLVENCLSIRLEVWKQGEVTCRIPLLIALVLLVVVPYVTVGLLAVGLCLGYRLHVTGKGTEGWGEKVNGVIDQITDTVSDAVRSLRRDKNEKRK